MFNPRTLSGQRWSALWNGVVIGVGIAAILSGIGVIFIVLGAGLEYWQRRRLRTQETCAGCGRPYQ
ncbi:MAG: hypothetical protein EXR48_04000 [Dehalococcoidia bacterium]|nr:hypothetical protein [Dehalococcoidia bacterium]